MTDNELPMLAGIAALIHWLEELLNIINGPLLLLGAGIALVDLLTDGGLTLTAPILLYAWAISQALGIDTQLLGCFARARTASGPGRRWARVGWLVLGIVLGFAAWQAGDVFAVQQAQHISEAAALAQLGVNPPVWLGWRAFLAVGLVALSGWTRYRKPAPASLDDERAQLERQLELEPLRRRLRTAQVGGWRSLAETALRGQQGASMVQGAPSINTVSAPFEANQQAPAAPQEVQQAASVGEAATVDGPDGPPTGPDSPSFASKRTQATGTTTQTTTGNVVALRRGLGRAPRQTRKQANRANARAGRRGTAEARVRAILTAEPGIAFDELVKRAKVSPSTASKYQAVWLAEQGVGRGALAQ